MHKRKRDLEKLAEEEGIKGVEISETNGGHYLIEGFYQGSTLKIYAPYSPSCHRALLNLRSTIRKYIRQIETGPVH